MTDDAWKTGFLSIFKKYGKGDISKIQMNKKSLKKIKIQLT